MTDKLAGAQWVTQVTDVKLATTYENGEKQVQGAEITAVHRYEYNGVDYKGDPSVKRNDVETEFFVPASFVLPQVGDVLAFEFVTVSQGLTDALPVIPLIDASAALEAGDDEGDE